MEFRTAAPPLTSQPGSTQMVSYSFGDAHVPDVFFVHSHLKVEVFLPILKSGHPHSPPLQL
jgi:hypothetical protein